MIIAYQILLFVLIVFFGLLAIGGSDDKTKNRAAKIVAVALISFLCTFWLI
ncbi:hypothetical protein [Sporosarcina highlanderae]|uniref:Uncharacterized protein n=1 Tax=Sporosarcina highlanderae TaxID=3035916 RepID=A0ABT8JQE8_9BACL|nr:hypothetical protein [Sporosarcina highlanderae]MDN4607368.1 hypothetical protein [Sporosarcina highlanderae]